MDKDSLESMLRKHKRQFNRNFIESGGSKFISMMEKQEKLSVIKKILKNKEEIKKVVENTGMSPLVISILFKREELCLYIIEKKLFFDDGLCYLSAIFSKQHNILLSLHLNQYPINKELNRLILFYINNYIQSSERVFYAFDILRIAYNRYILEYMDEADKMEASAFFNDFDLKKLKLPKHNWIVDHKIMSILSSTPGTISDTSKTLIRGLIEMIPVFTWFYGNSDTNWTTNAQLLIDCIYNDSSEGGITIKIRDINELVDLYNLMKESKINIKSNKIIDLKYCSSCLEPDTYKDYPLWIIDNRINALLWILGCDKWLSPSTAVI